MKKFLFQFLKTYKIPVGIILFFLIWMMFFDEYNWMRIRKEANKLEALKEERTYLKTKIEADREQLHTLQSDSEALERFAREEYLLKKENEDVYVIIEE
ncbi:MAG: septum formation initiator family protein [Prolixibacteraceae bacterium]|nr:septum formation initiator family protein [Prolixibacteraceae bacterium]MBN2648150.1 septum formation initiator family protein [Prolixibacteraceae bacterium]